MKTRMLVAMGVAGWLLGAVPGAWAYGTNQIPESPAVERLGGKVAVQFSSAVADPYYVLSGPVESYEAFRFNAMFREALGRYAAAKSGPGEEEVTLVVHLEALTTGYRQLGAGIPHQGGDWAAAGPIQLAAAGREVARGPFRSAAHFDEDGGDWSFPAEVTKSAALRFSAELRAAGIPAARESLSAHAELTVTWDDWDPWGPQWALRAYEYGPVLQGVIRDAMARIDGFVAGSIKTPGK